MGNVKCELLACEIPISGGNLCGYPFLQGFISENKVGAFSLFSFFFPLSSGLGPAKKMNENVKQQ